MPFSISGRPYIRRCNSWFRQPYTMQLKELLKFSTQKQHRQDGLGLQLLLDLCHFHNWLSVWSWHTLKCTTLHDTLDQDIHQRGIISVIHKTLVGSWDALQGLAATMYFQELIKGEWRVGFVPGSQHCECSQCCPWRAQCAQCWRISRGYLQISVKYSPGWRNVTQLKSYTLSYFETHIFGQFLTWCCTVPQIEHISQLIWQYEQENFEHSKWLSDRPYLNTGIDKEFSRHQKTVIKLLYYLCLAFTCVDTAAKSANVFVHHIGHPVYVCTCDNMPHFSSHLVVVWSEWMGSVKIGFSSVAFWWQNNPDEVSSVLATYGWATV